MIINISISLNQRKYSYPPAPTTILFIILVLLQRFLLIRNCLFQAGGSRAWLSLSKRGVLNCMKSRIFVPESMSKFSSRNVNRSSNSNPARSTTAPAPNRSSNNGDDPDWFNRRRSGRDLQKQVPKRGEEDEGDMIESSSSRISAVLVGTCPYMCPEVERAQRERLRDLAVFERLHGNPGKTSANLAVKKFCRTISKTNTQASDVRSLPVLEKTLSYLLNLVESTEQPFEAVHDFVFDRMRSIRQDLSMQNIVNEKAVYMYEEMVKFHIISHHKLRSDSGSLHTSSMHYLNMEQLTKALTTLLDLYKADRNLHSNYKNEAEFNSFYVLLHLGSASQAAGESLSSWFQGVPSRIVKSKEMCFARNILRFYRMSNYYRFFHTIGTEASYLHYCIIEPYIIEVRALALSFINYAGYKLHPYPLPHLSRILMMRESDAESFCNDCGLKTCTDESGSQSLPTKQTTFSSPKEEAKKYSFLGLEVFER